MQILQISRLSSFMPFIKRRITQPDSNADRNAYGHKVRALRCPWDSLRAASIDTNYQGFFNFHVFNVVYVQPRTLSLM